MKKKLLRITESAVSWIHRRSPHVKEIICYMVEPEEGGKDFVLRRMMTTDKKGNIQNIQNPPRLERKDNLFRSVIYRKTGPEVLKLFSCSTQASFSYRHSSQDNEG